MVQAILFDVDGVLVHPWRFRQWLEREHGITPAMTAPFFQGPFGACAAGKADLVDVLPPFLLAWGWTGSVTSFVAAWHARENAPDHEVLAIVATIRAAGMRCFVASTQDARRAAYLRQDMGFDRLFDDLFFSCAIGAGKPQQGFYRGITARLGLAGSELLFFDDAPANVAGARAAGWSAELFTNVASLRRDVERVTGLPLSTTDQG